MERQRHADERSRVVVAGAGIGGLTAAIALQRAGIPVLVLERAPALREVGAGITLWSNALRALRAMGADGAVLARGSELVAGDLRSPDGRTLSHTPLAPASLAIGSPCIALTRADLVDALHGRLAPGTVRTGCQVVGADLEPDHVRVRVAGGDELECAAFVGADGIGSCVREQLHGSSPPRYAGYTCWRAILDAPNAAVRAALTSGSAFETWGPGRRFGAMSVPGGRAYWFASENVPPGGGDVDARAHLSALFRGWHAPIEALIESTPATAILRNDIFDRDPLPRSRDLGRGRVTLLGDSAHASTPNLGQGACMAIEDALVLARCLTGARDVPVALREYERARRARTRLVTIRSRWLGRVGQIESSAACRARNVIMRTLPQAWTRRAYESIATSGPG